MSDRPLTPRTRKVLAVLTDEFLPPGVLARRAGLPTRGRKELAALACCELVRLGLAEWHYYYCVTRMGCMRGDPISCRSAAWMP